MNQHEHDTFLSEHFPALTGVLWDVVAERRRQDEKFGLLPPSILPGKDEWRKLAVLGEEVGEVARAMLETDLGNDTQEHVEEELIQVAAVAVAWVEFNRARRALPQPSSFA